MRMTRFLIGVFSSLFATVLFAGASLWTLTPLTATSLAVPGNGTALVEYTVTNQSSKSHTLVMTPIKGINQLSGNAPGFAPLIPFNRCNNVFVLAAKESCVLALEVVGSQLSSPITNGPAVCQQGNVNTCYQPSPQDALNISQSANRYSVGGNVSGLNGTVQINNGDDTLTISTDGPFTFPTTYLSGTPYNVTIVSNPATQTCTINNASGTIANANIPNVIVTCSTNTYSIGGTVAGLNGTLILQNNGTDNLTVPANGPFTFSTPIADGSTYSVTVISGPSDQTCTVNSGSGQVNGADVTSVSINCSINSYFIGGTVSGMTGSDQVVLQNNNTDNLTVPANGPFQFATAIAQNSSYSVTVLTNPPNKTCSVSNATGTVGAGNVTNVTVSCTVNTTTLSVSSTGLIEINSGGFITVTNTGSHTAFNVSAVLPSGWTQVIQSPPCLSLAPSGGHCDISFDSPVPYVAQGNIQIIGDNISNTPTTALAFTINSNLVFGLIPPDKALVIAPTDDTTSFWGNNVLTGANDFYDGSSNTNLIQGTLGIGAGNAASVCYAITNGIEPLGTWWLPAICQFDGPNTFPTSANCSPGFPNINDNLVKLGFGGLTDHYWSSTEYDISNAWLMVFVNGTSAEGPSLKSAPFKVRCARSITY